MQGQSAAAIKTAVKGMSVEFFYGCMWVTWSYVHSIIYRTASARVKTVRPTCHKLNNCTTFVNLMMFGDHIRVRVSQFNNRLPAVGFTPPLYLPRHSCHKTCSFRSQRGFFSPSLCVSLLKRPKKVPIKLLKYLVCFHRIFRNQQTFTFEYLEQMDFFFFAFLLLKKA